MNISLYLLPEQQVLAPGEAVPHKQDATQWCWKSGIQILCICTLVVSVSLPLLGCIPRAEERPLIGLLFLGPGSTPATYSTTELL